MRNAEKDEQEMTARREAMLAQGFHLFADRGIEVVSMQEVAKACGVGIATLYRYYNTKLALVIAIAVRQWTDYADYARAQREIRCADKMTAAQELEFYLDFYIDLYQNHKDILCFNQDFNNYIRHEGAAPEQLRPYVEAVNVFSALYEKGKKDGTIRTDLPEEKAFAATSHIMLAVAVRYAQGLLFSGENEADMTQEILLVKRMILKEIVIS